MLIASLFAATPAAAEVIRQPYGVTAAGERVERITLGNARGVRVGILSLGGIIVELRVPDRRGRKANVVLALPDLAAYEARPNFGSIIGRYAGRISGGGFTLDGVRHALSPDPAAIVSHGGRPGFGARVWRVEPCTAAGCSAVTLRLRSPDGENGFPGTLDVAVTFTLADTALRLDYAATTDRPTVVNLTHHAYFNLAGAASGNAEAQYLLSPVARVAELDARRVPTGRLLPVAGTPFDLGRPQRIGDRIGSAHPQIVLGRGFDHWFALAGRGLLPAACAFDPGSGRTLMVSTDAPGFQLYTAGGFDGSLIGATGRGIARGDGYAIETQGPPDAPNRSNFPSTILRPGQTLRSTTLFRFGTAASPGTFARGCRRS